MSDAHSWYNVEYKGSIPIVNKWERGSTAYASLSLRVLATTLEEAIKAGNEACKVLNKGIEFELVKAEKSDKQVGR